MNDVGGVRREVSAFELGRLLGDALPAADSVGADELALVEAARTLLDAVVRTAVDDPARARAAADIARVVDDLRVRTRDDLVRLVRHPDGRIENLVQAAAGRCNPRSLRLRFDDMTPPEPGVVDTSIVVHGRCVLDASASGPPERAHGGIVTTILDEALGVAIMRAGRTGMTAAMDVSFKGAAPLGVELHVTAQVTSIEGRKTFAEAELFAGDTVVARARGLFVASRAAGAPPAGPA